MIINGEKSIIMDNESFRRATFQKKILLDSMTKKYSRFCYKWKNTWGSEYVSYNYYNAKV